MAKDTCSECTFKRRCKVVTKCVGGIPILVCGVCWDRLNYVLYVGDFNAN